MRIAALSRSCRTPIQFGVLGHQKPVSAFGEKTTRLPSAAYYAILRSPSVRFGAMDGSFLMSIASASQYRSLGAAKGAFRPAAQRHFADPPDCHEDSKKEHLTDEQLPAYAERLMTGFTQEGKLLAETYPSDTCQLVALGRSPLMLLETVVTLKAGGHQAYTLLSGSSFKKFDRKLEEDGIDDYLEMLMTDDQGAFDQWVKEGDRAEKQARIQEARKNLMAYKQYMAVKQVDPERIVARASAGKRTIMCDSLYSGRSLLFFARMLALWAQEQECDSELKEALTFHIYLPLKAKTDINEYLSAVRDLGFNVVTDDKGRESGRLFPMRQAMYTNGWGMGMYLNLCEMPQLDEILTQEQAADSSLEASLARFVLYDYLDSQGELPV